jgi:hypothetical protein
MGDDIVMKFKKCPNCQEMALERLETYSHCVQCNFSPVLKENDDPYNIIWAAQYLKTLAQDDSEESEHILGKVVSL